MNNPPKTRKELFQLYYEVIKPLYAASLSQNEMPAEFFFECMSALDHLATEFRLENPVAEEEAVSRAYSHLLRGCRDICKLAFIRCLNTFLTWESSRRGAVMLPSQVVALRAALDDLKQREQSLRKLENDDDTFEQWIEVYARSIDLISQIELSMGSSQNHPPAAMARTIDGIKTSASPLEQFEVNRSAEEFVGDASKALEIRESRNREIATRWHCTGYLSLLMTALLIGVLTATRLFASSQIANVSAFGQLILGLAALTVIAVSLSAAKYAFELGKSYMHEAIRCSDKSHAIYYGRLYLRLFSGSIDFKQMQEVFQTWNLESHSSFSTLKAADFESKLFDNIKDLAAEIVKSTKAKS